MARYPKKEDERFRLIISKCDKQQRMIQIMESDGLTHQEFFDKYVILRDRDDITLLEDEYHKFIDFLYKFAPHIERKIITDIFSMFWVIIVRIVLKKDNGSIILKWLSHSVINRVWDKTETKAEVDNEHNNK